jgi:hypothetical protein
VDESIVLLKVAVTFLLMATPVAALGGVVELTIGATPELVPLLLPIIVPHPAKLITNTDSKTTNKPNDLNFIEFPPLFGDATDINARGRRGLDFCHPSFSAALTAANYSFSIDRN